jgi:hypothetical protein
MSHIFLLDTGVLETPEGPLEPLSKLGNEEKVRESLDFVFAGPTPCGEVVFQAAINLLQSFLNGTIRLIVSPGSPIRFNSPTGMLFCACPAILLVLWGR